LVDGFQRSALFSVSSSADPEFQSIFVNSSGDRNWQYSMSYPVITNPKEAVFFLTRIDYQAAPNKRFRIWLEPPQDTFTVVHFGTWSDTKVYALKGYLLVVDRLRAESKYLLIFETHK